MRRLSLFIHILIAFALLSGAPRVSFAQNCAEAFAILQGKQTVGPKEVKAFVQIFTDILNEGKVPAFLKSTKNGKVPVVLVNEQTYPKIKSYLENSLGTDVHMQPDWDNDHGGIRVLGNLIDVDLPGDREFGEINKTGIAWKPVDSYLAHTAHEDAIIEVSYALTPEEIKVADAYHRVRRAAFYRVPFTFGDAENNMRLANMLDEGEHCFTFCKAEQVGNHVDELQGLLRASGVNDPEAFLARPDVKKFLAQAEELVLRTNDKRLNPKILTNNAGVRALLTKIAPAGVKGKPQKLQNFADALVGYDVTREYKTLMRNLNVTGDTGFQDMNNPRVTAVLIYEDPAKAKAFRNATYSTPGKFSSWTAAGQSVLKP